MQTPSYDTLGRLSQSVECLGAESEGCTDFTTQYGYDDFSRLQLTTVPGGKKVYREYNNNILKSLRREGEDGSLIWQMNNMDARGRPNIEKTGNGAETHYTYNYSNDQGGMLSNIRVNNGVEDIMDRAYVYDPNNAQLISRTDRLFDVGLSLTQHEQFTYDEHRRVATNEVSVNGIQTQFHTYGYDELGNIIEKPDHADAVNQAYTYGEGITDDGAGPHAIKALGSRDFTYDASGNLLNDGVREARWKSFEKPEMLRKGTATIWFEYGAGNNRTRRRQGNFNTWYLNGGADVQIERLTHNNNSDVTTKYHYLANGKVVAIDEESSSGTEERYLHSDRLGSASVLTDSFGVVVEKMSYDIWGQVRNLSSGANSSVLKSGYHTKSYTGHEALADVDLVHMNGRIYDPIFGRFMSADPFVQYVFNSQSYNRYSYVLNNPLGATDPSGYFSISLFGEEISVEFGGGSEGDESYADDSGSSNEMGSVPNDRSAAFGADSELDGFERELGYEKPKYIQDDILGKLAAIAYPDLSVEDAVKAGVTAVVANAIANAVWGRAGKFATGVQNTFKRSKDSLHEAAEDARDALVANLKNSKYPPAAVVGGYSPSTGKVTAGVSKGGGLGCAEDSCSEALGNPTDIQFTKATRPRNDYDVPACTNCEDKYGRSAFPDPNTRYQSEGAKPLLEE